MAVDRCSLRERSLLVYAVDNHHEGERRRTGRVKGLQMWGALLLLVSSLILLIPPVYTALSRVTPQNRPWIQILLGVVGVIVALAQFAGGPEEKA